MLESFEADEWKTVDNLEEELARAKAAARNFLERQASELEDNAGLRAEMKEWDQVFG